MVESTTLPLPCRWATQGCVEVLARDGRREHEGICGFRREEVQGGLEEVLPQERQGNPRLGLLEHVVIGLALCLSILFAMGTTALSYFIFKLSPTLFLCFLAYGIWYNCVDGDRIGLCRNVIIVLWFYNFESTFLTYISLFFSFMDTLVIYHLSVTEHLDFLFMTARRIVR